MRLKKEIIAEIYQHALKEYPFECCGIVTGEGSSQTAHLCQNIQNRLHARDPETYPRDARTAYTINRDEADRICAETGRRGEKVTAFYHSHINCDAYFSEIDKEAQTVFGEPEFPDALQLVVSVIDGRISGMKCYQWDRDTRCFKTIQVPD